MDEETLKPGSRLGDYQIVAELGGGGMGRVYRATDLTLERTVALKTLAPQLKNDEMIVKRFLMEARAAARLNHPNIVQIYDFGKEGDTYYLAMEYIEGDSLASLLKKRGAFAEVDAITITRFACHALATAHAEGLVHRDIKPDNLMLTKKGELKLVDLGVAKRVGPGEDQSMTQTGQALGTPHYISPEQIRAAKDIDGRADIYSLGATLFHLVTAKTPFRGSSGALVMSMHLYQALEDPRKIVPGLSEGLVQVLRKMMAKDPKDRYADCEALDRDLYQLEIGEAPEAAAAGDSFDSAVTSEAPLLQQEQLEREGGGATQRVLAASVPRASASLTSANSASSTSAAGPGASQGAAGPAKSSASMTSAAATSASASASVTSAKNTGMPTGLNTTDISADPKLKALETELAKHVGPLARVLVKRAAKTATSLPQLINELEREIPGEKPRRAFRAAVDKLR